MRGLLDLPDNDRRRFRIEWFFMVVFAVRAGREPIQNELARPKRRGVSGGDEEIGG